MILPFRLPRHREFVWRQASAMAAMKPDQAKAHLTRQTRCQADTMARRDVTTECIAAQTFPAEAVIRRLIAAMANHTGDAA